MKRLLFSLACIVILEIRGAAQSDPRKAIQEHYERAQQALRARQDSLAREEFREILRLDPRNASAHANVGTIAFTERNYTDAAQEFRTALKLQPSLWNAEAFLGMSELRLGHGPEAESLLEDSFQRVQDPQLKSNVGMDLITLDYSLNQLEKAADVVRVLRGIKPDAPEILYTAYRTYSDLAARTLSALAQVAPDSAEMHRILAQALASQDDFPGSIAQYRKAVAMNPHLPGIHYELGQMILANAQDEAARKEATKEFELALAADPRDAYSHYMLGEIEWLRSRPEEALKHYLRAIELRPNFDDAQIAAGKALTALGRPAEAQTHLLEAARLDPHNEIAHYRLAQAYRQLGRKEQADREEQEFRKLRDSHQPVRALFQQVQERPLLRQTVGPNERP